ncbi:ROK family protein [Vibrio sp. ZSDZ65]|uniref:N-acetylglucosamine kinase n=1 Tax=Vibrio qingdaonensis TaxID=2829491 RepID=A0A9X3CPN8_9VIBR|nr:ROK family protein [Vibrio qingdaonensis]MCW8346899.1 ROK family protein [Vibrio qingdaonensis]
MLYGLDIGGTKIELRAYDTEFNEQLKVRVATPRNCYDGFIDAVVDIVEHADKELGCIGNIGIGIPGSESSDDHTIFAPNIPSIDGLKIREPIEKRLQRPIFIDNDANCFALSESQNDQLERSKHVLGLILGTGFGAGLAIDQKSYSGANQLSMELGHTPLSFKAFQAITDANKGTPVFTCECGSEGCLDRYLSGTGFEDLYTFYTGKNHTALQIIEAYDVKVPEVITFVERYFDLLSLSIAPFINTFDPDVVVLGGGLSNFDQLYPALNERLPQLCLKRDHFPLVIKARYGDSSGVRGAAMLSS